MGDSINLGVSIMGKEEANKNQIPAIRSPNRENIIKKINSLNVSETIINLLLKKLNNYPDSALNSFWINLPKLIETLKQKDAKNEI